MNSKPFLVSLVLLVFAQGWILGDQDSDILLDEDFDQIKADSMGIQAVHHDQITLQKGAGPDGSDAIRVRYVGYDRGSQRVVFRYPLAKPVTAAVLEYDVCFDQDFQWVLGGKLHGLGPMKPITGGKQRLPTGWSARITFKPDGHCATYLYDQDTSKTYGIGDPSETQVFKKGEWHHVRMEVKLNDPGIANGSARILVDGKEVVHTRQVQFRGNGNADTEIQQFLFSTFHGGHRPKNAPIDETGAYVTVHALFDNFRVRQARPGN